MMALENGFNLLIAKPISFNINEAVKLNKKTALNRTPLAFAHNYSGYPAVKLARQMVDNGDLEKI